MQVISREPHEWCCLQCRQKRIIFDINLCIPPPSPAASKRKFYHVALSLVLQRHTLGLAIDGWMGLGLSFHPNIGYLFAPIKSHHGIDTFSHSHIATTGWSYPRSIPCPGVDTFPPVSRFITAQGVDAFPPVSLLFSCMGSTLSPSLLVILMQGLRHLLICFPDFKRFRCWVGIKTNSPQRGSKT